MPCSINFSATLQTEILSTVTSDFLKQMIILKSFNSVFFVFQRIFIIWLKKSHNIKKKSQMHLNSHVSCCWPFKHQKSRQQNLLLQKGKHGFLQAVLHWEFKDKRDNSIDPDEVAHNRYRYGGWYYIQRGCSWWATSSGSTLSKFSYMYSIISSFGTLWT